MMDEVALETDRLILRTVTPADIQEVASGWKLDDGAITLAEASQKIQWMRANHARNRPGGITHLCLAIFLKGSQEIIGWCGLDHTCPADADPALFYLLKARYWGQGFATEAASALLAYAFAQLKLASIHGGAAPENLASRRVMEKLGMTYLGLDREGGYAFTLAREAYKNPSRTDNA